MLLLTDRPMFEEGVQCRHLPVVQLPALLLRGHGFPMLHRLSCPSCHRPSCCSYCIMPPRWLQEQVQRPCKFRTKSLIELVLAGVFHHICPAGNEIVSSRLAEFVWLVCRGVVAPMAYPVPALMCFRKTSSWTVFEAGRAGCFAVYPYAVCNK